MEFHLGCGETVGEVSGGELADLSSPNVDDGGVEAGSGPLSHV